MAEKSKGAKKSPAQMLTIKEAANVARVSTRTVHRWISAGLITPRRTPTGFARINASDILALSA